MATATTDGPTDERERENEKEPCLLFLLCMLHRSQTLEELQPMTLRVFDKREKEHGLKSISHSEWMI